MPAFYTAILPKIIMRHKLAAILILGLAFRLILAPISIHPLDGAVWYDTSQKIIENGPLSVQWFPPTQGSFFLIPTAYLFHWISQTFSLGTLGPTPLSALPAEFNFYPSVPGWYVPGIVFNIVSKIPILLSDVFVALLLFKIIKNYKKDNLLAETAAALWLLNPYVIWISSGWGMWDSIPALFSLVSFYFLMEKKYFTSSMFLIIGIASKLYPALFILPMVFFILKENQTGKKLANLARFCIPVLTAFLIFLTTYSSSIFSFIEGWFLPMVSAGQSISNPVEFPLGFGLTYWSISGVNRFTNLHLNTLIIVGAIVASTFLMISAVLYTYLKTTKVNFRKDELALSAVFLVTLFAVFLTTRIVNEQFFMWAIPFLVILVLCNKIKPSIYWGLSLIALLYSFLNCPLPFFFLALSPFATGSLSVIISGFLALDLIRIILLAVLGLLFSILLLIAVKDLKGTFSATKKRNFQFN